MSVYDFDNDIDLNPVRVFEIINCIWLGLANLSRSCGEESLALLGHLKSGQSGAVPGQAEKLSDVIRRLAALGEQLLPKVDDIKVRKGII